VTYSDEYLFCTFDGTSLVPIFDAVEVETTVLRPLPFTPQSSQPVRQGVNPMFLYVAVGLLVLVVSGVLFVSLKSDSSSSSTAKNEVSTNASNFAEPKSNKEQERLNQEKANLQEEQERLERERQKLANERKKLETKKKETYTPPTSNVGAAIVFAPPSNVRESPSGGGIQCSVTRRTTIRILGSTGVYDNNGLWYYTDVCGRTGVIHSTQIRF
jgi:cell division protein FtsN